ncbi:MAG: tetratricopeptide repeat protein, partial [Deltaproteobacteria bacterium]|nr:tetratricopeptide repeat protein [Deltaproteobacteria bacterium]
MALAHNLLGVVYVQKGQYDQAVTEAQRAIALDPNSPAGYSSLAQVLNNEVKPTEALEAVETAMRLDPRNPDKYLTDQAFAYSLLGRWKEAIPVWKRILVRFPDNIWAHAFLADAYSCTDDADGARAETAAIERAIALSPNSALGYMALAQGLSFQGRPAEALIAADKAVRLDPRHGDNLPPIYLMYEGSAYTLLGRW